MRRGAALLVAVALLVACAKPIPQAHRAMVGVWEGPGMVVQITDDGRLSYRRDKRGGKVSIDAPIQEIGFNRFSAGVGPMSTEFKLDRGPHQDNGVWSMTVDGVVLFRRGEAGPRPPQVER